MHILHAHMQMVVQVQTWNSTLVTPFFWKALVALFIYSNTVEEHLRPVRKGLSRPCTHIYYAINLTVVLLTCVYHSRIPLLDLFSSMDVGQDLGQRSRSGCESWFIWGWLHPCWTTLIGVCDFSLWPCNHRLSHWIVIFDCICSWLSSQLRASICLHSLRTSLAATLCSTYCVLCCSGNARY